VDLLKWLQKVGRTDVGTGVHREGQMLSSNLNIVGREDRKKVSMIRGQREHCKLYGGGGVGGKEYHYERCVDLWKRTY